MLALVGVVDDGGGQNQTASHHEVGKIAHECGGGTLDQEFQKDLHTFAGNCGRRPKEEAAQQHR